MSRTIPRASRDGTRSNIVWDVRPYGTCPWATHTPAMDPTLANALYHLVIFVGICVQILITSRAQKGP
jgi:hypothetical protein